MTRLVALLAVAVGCGDNLGLPTGLDTRPANPTCLAPPRPPNTAPIAFVPAYANVTLDTPLVMTQIVGDPTRWFVAERGGNIASFPADGSADATVLANIPAMAGIAINLDGEGGLLGLALHPDFIHNGRAFVSWTSVGGATAANMRSVVAEIHSPDNGASFDSYKVILGPFDQPYNNHDGGGAVFGKDGFLYLSFGDGGTPDPAQDPYRFFSKLLRIDVDHVPAGQTYGIPADNPYANGGGEPATYARGFRNPYRFSIDRGTGDAWVGDVGQNDWEEIDHVAIGGNYGWPCREGAHDLNVGPPNCPSRDNLIDPVVEVSHADAPSRAIIGGVVYRGSAIPAFVGNYVFADYITQQLFTLTYDAVTGAAIATALDGTPASPWGSFAEDPDGEVYVISLTGQIVKMVAAGAPTGPPFPARLSLTGCVDPQDPKTAAPGLVPYDVNVALWSDGADKQRYLAIPDGTTITTDADGDFDLPIGSVLMKTFALAGQNVETRLFVHHADGDWAGYSYEWLDDQSDALLLPSSKTTATWQFPSRGDCLRCHTVAAGRSLGLELRQLNRSFAYPGGSTGNEVATLVHLGMLDASAASSDARVGLPTVHGPALVQDRARAYLHANCSNCHRPGGGGGGTMDLRFGTALHDSMTCGAAPQIGALGIAGAQLIAPGDPSTSLVSVRPHLLDANRMPPVATRVVDTDGLGVIDAWITSLSSCP